MLGGAATHFASRRRSSTRSAPSARSATTSGRGTGRRCSTRGTITDDVEHVPGGKTFFWPGEYQRQPQRARDARHRPQRLRDLRAASSRPRPRTATCCSWPTSSPTSSAACASSAHDARFVAMDSMNLWIDIARDSLEQTIRSRRLPDPQRRGARAADRQAARRRRPPRAAELGAAGRSSPSRASTAPRCSPTTASSRCPPTRSPTSSTRPARATASPAASSATSPPSRDEPIDHDLLAPRDGLRHRAGLLQRRGVRHRARRAPDGRRGPPRVADLQRDDALRPRAARRCAASALRHPARRRATTRGQRPPVMASGARRRTMRGAAPMDGRA